MIDGCDKCPPTHAVNVRTHVKERGRNPSLTAAVAIAQAPPIKQEPVSSPELKAYMKTVVEPAANALFAAGNDAPAGETAEQATARFRAADNGAKALRAASAKLLAAPLARPGDWAKFATAMATGATAVEAAAKTRNVDAALSAGGDLYDSCNGCHHIYQAGH